MKNVILGGGPAGIGAANALGAGTVMFEKNPFIGGLCSSFEIKGFRFDHSVHLSFTNNPEVLTYLQDIPVFHHPPFALNYANGLWLKNPVLNNLFPLSPDEKKKILISFEQKPSISKPENYKEWLIASFGSYFAENYPCRYTRKYWCVDAENLSTEWCEKRMYSPKLEEVIQGAETEKTPNVYYAKDMRYPKRGGFRSFYSRINNDVVVKTGYEVKKIVAKDKMIFFENGETASYSSLFYSLPLNKVCLFFDDAPAEVKEASSKLVATSMANVSIGFKRHVHIPSLWFYIYDEDVPFARAYSPSLKSSDNAPKGKSSIQFEYYYIGARSPLSSEFLIKKAEEFLEKSGISKKRDIEVEDVSFSPYANVVFLLGMEKQRKIVLDYLKSSGVIPIGRFGQWDYLWSDEAFFSGFSIAKKNL